MDIRKTFLALLGRSPFLARRKCNICDHRVAKFLPYGGGWKAVPPLMVAINLVGSDVDSFECPWCGAFDRERHLLMYMQAIGLFDSLGDKEILHFAPERRIAGLVQEQQPLRYVKADLFPVAPDIERIDMLSIPYDDQTFDVVIANHVLEHVSDDRRCVEELRRILRIGGLAILQTPFSSRLQVTWSDDGIDDDAARLQAYGQEDHVRLFGADIVSRFSESGLTSRVQSHEELLPDIDAGMFGVNREEPLFLFERTS